jgi:hypothetical protein
MQAHYLHQHLKTKHLDIALKDLIHLSKVIAEQSIIKKFFKNPTIKINQQR